VEVRKTIVEVTVREEITALDILAEAKQTGLLKHFEVTSASLEDVFVELLDKKASAG
ncbi:MAG: DUF4162 domain-containing protein, partial [Ignavibacteriales bacterium]|nr:DUF4162 domain-containing protein [Ignavibacteriales bacterium]